jgi:spore coat protein A, manganese oxidase
MQLSRRDMLKIGLFSSAALMLPAERMARAQLALDNRIPTSDLPKPFTLPFQRPPVLTPDYATPDTAYYTLTQQQVQIPILGPGRPSTTIWGYNGYTPGPTIVNQQGQKAVVRQINSLPKVHPELRYNVWTSTHLHGSCSLPQYDGYASDITNPGQYKDYHYPNVQDARTLWYHDHGVHITAPNAYMGLAAQYILHDPVEQALPIPHGPYDVPFILKDAMFQKNGDLIYEDNNESGIYGDVILVNGVPWPLMQVEPRKYRFRMLNASISRSYDLALDSGDPLTVIGTDGGLMPHPQPVGNFRIGMAERYEVVIDFSKYKPGQRVVLRNLQPKNNIEYATTNVVCAFEVGSTVTSTANNEIPQDLNPNMRTMGLTEDDAVRTRKFEFKRQSGHWTINGTTWEDVVNSDYEMVIANPGIDDVEIWELENPHGGWFHPVHIHLVDFQILDRSIKGGPAQPPMPHERGPKDVAYVGEDEVVRVIMRFENQRGRYMMHCHNLVHEDHDMMTQFQVGEGGDDPIKADRCKDLPAGPLFVIPDDDHDHGDDHGGGDHGGDDHGGDHGGDDHGSAPAPAADPAAAPAPAAPAAAAPAAAAPAAGALAAKGKTKRKRKRKVVKHRAAKAKAPKHKPAKHKPAKHKASSRRRRGKRS